MGKDYISHHPWLCKQQSQHASDKSYINSPERNFLPFLLLRSRREVPLLPLFQHYPLSK